LYPRSFYFADKGGAAQLLGYHLVAISLTGGRRAAGVRIDA